MVSKSNPPEGISFNELSTELVNGTLENEVALEVVASRRTRITN